MKSIVQCVSRLVTAAALITWWISPSMAADPVRFALDWVPYGKHAGFFSGVERGYYAKAGLDVKIQRGFGADTLKILAGGQGDFILAETDQLAVRRGKGLMAKVLGMAHDKSLFVILSFEERGIKTPKDLEGKKIGAPVYTMPRVIFPAFAKHVGIDKDKVEWVTMDGPATVPALLSGQVPVMATFQTIFPAVKAGALKLEKKLNIMLYSDYGFDIYSGAVAAMDSLVKERPDYVRRFVQASYQALAWSIQNPEESVRDFLKTHPQASYDISLAQFIIFIDHIMTPYGRQHGLGQVSAEKMQKTRDVALAVFPADRVPEVSELYTNEFLPKLFPKRKGVECKLCP
ncbi:MAG: ABC transporter substrate-binding protein [Candidatus Tectomicrobia bacterium]|nr:ABC transporter substrate-binding protein [Candidatus Tectomicrobia bacterium]